VHAFAKPAVHKTTLEKVNIMIKDHSLTRKRICTDMERRYLCLVWYCVCYMHSLQYIQHRDSLHLSIEWFHFLEVEIESVL